MRRVQMFTLILLALLGSLASAQTVKVTFIVNTSTVPDTLHPDKAVVQVRGDTAPLKWDGTTGVTLVNMGGDYWIGSAAFPANDTILYKFFTNAVGATGDNEHKGWENDILPDGNHVLITGTSDIVLPFEFVNGTPVKQPMNWRPWTTGVDSISIRVRVNMQGWQAFNAASDRIGARGAAYPGYLGNLSWAHTLYLEKEEQHGNNGSRQYNAENFYSGTVKIPRDSVSEGQNVEFKFVIAGNDPDADPKTWESRNNRIIRIPVGKADTTIHWSWFNDVAPVPFVGADTLDITWRVDMTKAIATRGFKTGDTVIISTGWGGTGRDVANNSPVRTVLTKKGFTNIYEGTQQIIGAMNSPLYYQYYLVKEGQDIRESYYNFDYQGSDNSLAERRRFMPLSAALTVEDIVVSQTDARRMPFFRNTSVLNKTVNVTWVCDLRPAYYTVLNGKSLNAGQGDPSVFNADSVYLYGLWMNGPATVGVGRSDWSGWGQPLRDEIAKKMLDDGTNGDAVAGDHLYTVRFTYGPDSTILAQRLVGQEFKFGLGGGDNEGGFGNNHIENIDDSQTDVVINTQFGSIDPKYYNAWDYNTGTPVSVDRLGGVPTVYRLDQNYPNPFNPSTNITYSVPKAGWVTIKVYNALGQYMTTLVSGPAEAGDYRVQFDASGFESGVYMYEFSVDGFRQTRTMTLVK